MIEPIAKAPQRPPRFSGLFPDDTADDSYWIRERAVVQLPPLVGVREVSVIGELLAEDPHNGTSGGPLGLELRVDGAAPSRHDPVHTGDFHFEAALPEESPTTGPQLHIELLRVGMGNFLAWLGRVTRLGPLQAWRRQARNRRLRIRRIEANGEVLFDFSNRASPWNRSYLRRHLRVGMNIAGFFRAELGIGESARCMARAADAAGLPAALVDLKLPCKNPLGDASFSARLQPDNPHPVTVFHIDPPVARDVDHHHGEAFRRGKYNVGYWAWELPEFPDAWTPFAEYFDEIWTPSRFAADAIAEKVAAPVLVMPHAISVARPAGDARRRFGLPADQFLFLFLYDLNSYSERKNPRAVLAAFRESGLAGHGAALVIKVHNTAGNEADFARLKAACSDLPGTVLLTDTLSRADICALESACDCFVSLHRSEGFGLAVAECMALGKPVISTDWSGTSEFLNHGNGCPVRCSIVTLERNHGPYSKGQVWADPDTAHAAEWMKRLHGDRDLAARLGDAARKSIEARLSPAVIGARYRRRLEAIAGW